MGVGRRTFLKLSGLALAGAMIDPLQAVATHKNAYVNKKLGIMFHIPENWGFIKVKDFGKVKNEQILDGIYETIKDEVWKDLGDPICIVTKYFQDLSEYKGIFSPTITLNINYKDNIFGEGVKNMDELLELSELGVSNILKDFKVIKRYEPYIVSNHTIYERDSEYLFEHVDLKSPTKVELKAYKVEHNDYLYEFNCHQSKAQSQIAHKEFEQFKNSIKLI